MADGGPAAQQGRCEATAAEGCAGAQLAARRDSGRTVRVGFEDADAFHQRIELRRVVADDAGAAHGVVVGLQAGKLVVVGTRRSRPSRQ